MIDYTMSGLSAAERRAQVEAELAQYPALSEDQVRGLLHWFRREASAYDAAMVACNEAIRPAYTQFKADHLDRFSSGDVLRGVAFAVAVLIVFAMIVGSGN